MGGGNIYAFIYSNLMLEYILLEDNKSLFNLFIFENSIEVYDVIVDKTKVDKLCRQLGLSRPLEYDLAKEEQLDKIKYPIVIKPLEKQKAKGASKCMFIYDRLALDKYLQEIKSYNISIDNLVCQQAVRGLNKWEYGYGGYFKNGRPIVDICFHQFRQSPQGLSCYIREITNLSLQHSLRSLVQPFLNNLHYNGFIEFDIKQDEITKELFVLDINPRPWGSADILNVKLGESSVYEPKLTKYNAVWRRLSSELFSHRNINNISYKECKMITGKKEFRTVHALYDKNDLNVFYYHFKIWIIQILKKQLFRLKSILNH